MTAARTPVPVVVYGLGPIGRRIAARLVTAESPATVVAGVDLAPERVLPELRSALGDGIDLPVATTLDAALADWDGSPGVVVLATGSRLVDVASQITECVGRGWNVLSTCEELSYPAGIDEALTARLDAAATSNGVSVLGAGINPGFLMDALPVVLSLATTRVVAVSVRRRVNTDERRVPLQQKAGVGMTVEAFDELARTGGIGHVGLRQSAFLLASGLGWEVESYEESVVPVVAKEPVKTQLGLVPAGGVIGQHQLARARCGGEAVIDYDLEMSARADNVDEIDLFGPPDIHSAIRGGVNGDTGTEAVIANLVPAVERARPGVLTMVDLLGIGRARTPDAVGGHR